MQTKNSEAGFAAIVIAIVLVIILSLTTVGFASLMRTETNSTTTSHLSSQAYYAAESGINDAAATITSTNFFTDFHQKTSCAHESWEHPEIGNNSGVNYSCLLVNPAPDYLEYSDINTDRANVIQLTGVQPSMPTNKIDISKIKISWQNVGTSPNTYVTDGQHNFPKDTDWGNRVGVMRIALTPLLDNRLTSDNIINQTYTAYAYPNAGSGITSDYDYNNGKGAQAGAIIDGNCNDTAPLKCSVEIKNLSGTPNYVLNLRSIYRQSHVKVEAFSGDTPIRIANAQTVIDSTGRAQDTLRRIQVRVASQNKFDVANYPLEVSGTLCKQLQLVPTTSYIDSSANRNECSSDGQ